MRHINDIERQIDASFKRRLGEVVRRFFPDQLGEYERHADQDLIPLLARLNQAAPGLALRFGVARTILDLGLLGFTVLSCPDVGQAFDVIYRYHGLTSDAYRVQLSQEGDRVRLAAWVKPSSQRYRTVIAEEFITGFWVVLAELLPSTANRDRVGIQLDYSPPGYAPQYAELMPCDVEFDSRGIALTFPAEWSPLELETADATVAAVCRAECDQLLQTVGPGSGIVDDVKRLILSVPSNRRPSLHEVAAQMAMSPRTLERRLQEQGAGFRRIENEIRMGLAAQYVSLGSMTGKQVSSMLGYSNPSAFYRAFRSWHGQTPAIFRDRNPDRASRAGNPP
jgi:AraC-like DNA-binding protein